MTITPPFPVPTNLPPAGTNRFQQLLAAVPSGPFYDANGFIIPYTSYPYQFRLETNTPLQAFGVYINDVFVGTISTDATGIAIVAVSIRQGQNTLKLVNATTQEPFLAYVDARRTATWHASYADVLEIMDAEGEDIYNARSLDTVSPNYAEDVYGVPLTTPNDSGYSNVSYVNILQDLRQSYRGYGGMPRGLRAGVGAFLSSNPLDVSDAWIPEWDLGFDLCPNGRLQQLARSSTAQLALAGVDLPNINQVSRTYIKASILDNSATLVYSPTHQPPIPQIITITATGAWSGGTITIVGLDSTNTPISETITPINGTASTTFLFASITTITKAAVGGAGAVLSIGTGVSRYVTLNNLGSYNAIGSALALEYRSTPSLQWASGDIYPVNPMQVPSGLYTLTDPDRAAVVFGIPQSPFNLDPLGAGANTSAHIDQLYLAIDHGLTVHVDLSPSTSITAASVVTAINTAVGSSVAAAVTGTEGVNGIIVKVTSPTTGPSSEVRLDPGPADCSSAVFGVPRNHTTLANPASIGDTTLTVVSGTVFPSIPSAPKLAKFQQTNHTIQGIGLEAPSASTALGIGAIRLVITNGTNKTLAYVSPGDTLGTAQQVSSGGTFTLTSANGTDTLVITVDSAQLNQSSTTQTLNDNLLLYTAGQYKIRVRGRRFGAVDGQITASGVTATFHSASANFHGFDLGGSVRISGSGNAGNNGLHIIIGFLSSTSVTILNAGASIGTTFVSEGPGDTWSLFSAGEVHTVIGLSGNVITLNEPMTGEWLGNVGVYVELADQIPTVIDGITGPGTLNVTVNPVFTPPGGPLTDNITPLGTNIPDGWHPTNVTQSYEEIQGFLKTSQLVVRSTTAAGPTDVSISRPIPGALDYIGLPLRAVFWVQEHSAASANFRIDVSINGGISWLNGTPVAVSGTVEAISGTVAVGSLNPTPIRRTFYLPISATSLWIRLTRISAAENPLTFSVARVEVDSATHTALFLGNNTIPRSAQRANFRELIYLWSPSALLASEDRTLGITPGNVPPYTSRPGHIDLLMPAHESVERFDVSEYDPTTGLPLNLFGVYTDNDWATNATLTNMQVVVGTPARLSYARPTRVSQVQSEALEFTVAGGGVDSLALSQPVAYFGPISTINSVGAGTNFVLSRVNGSTWRLIDNSGNNLFTTNMLGSDLRLASFTHSANNGTFIISNVDSVNAVDFTNSIAIAETGPAPATWAVLGGTPDGTAVLTGISSTYQQVLNGITIQSPTLPGDAVTVPDTVDGTFIQPWNWIVGNQLFINNAYFDSSADYSITYNAMIRVETGTITLPSMTMTNYVWLVDVAYYTRVDLIEGTESLTEQMTFRSDYTAALSSNSNQDLSSSVLIADNGLTRTAIAQADWSYLNSSTIRINPAVFDVNALYSFSYSALYPQLTPPASILIEWKSASTSMGLASAVYQTVQNGEPVNPVDIAGTYNGFHQMRVTVSGVVDVRDARVYSVGLRGLHLYGGSPNAPGIVVSG